MLKHTKRNDMVTISPAFQMKKKPNHLVEQKYCIPIDKQKSNKISNIIT